MHFGCEMLAQSVQGRCHRGAPLFGSSSRKNGDIFKPSMYLGQFIVSAELALDAIPRCQVAVLGQMRSVTVGLLLQVQLTESTSNID